MRLPKWARKSKEDESALIRPRRQDELDDDEAELGGDEYQQTTIEPKPISPET